MVVFEEVEGGVEWQAGAHPQEHSRSQAIARRPEVEVVELGIGQVVRH